MNYDDEINALKSRFATLEALIQKHESVLKTAKAIEDQVDAIRTGVAKQARVPVTTEVTPVGHELHPKKEK